MSDETYKDQLRLLELELNRVPDDTPTKGLWNSLFHVLTSWGHTVDRIKQLEDTVKVIQSDARETKNMVSRFTNGGIKFDPNNHPYRRKTDHEKDTGDADKLLNWLKREVLPGLVRRVIDFVIGAFVILVLLHYFEIIDIGL